MKKILIRIITVVVIGMIFGMIFSFSNQDGTESKSVSRQVARALIELQPKYKNITENEKQKLVESYQPLVRKGAHFTIYTILGMSLVTFLCTYKLADKKRMLISLCIGIGYAISDEIHQIFIPGRTALVIDVFIDTAGAILGILLIIGCKNIIRDKTLKQKCNKNEI